MPIFIKPKTAIVNLLLAGIILFALSGCISSMDVYDAHNQAGNVIPGIEKTNDEDALFVSFVATGQGLAPEVGSDQKKKLLADRAAVVDAYRNLSERVTGFIVDGYTRQGMSEISIDKIRVESNTYIRGAKVVDVVYAEGVSTATIKVLLPTNKRFLVDSVNKNRITPSFSL
ncbi:MAG: LPP20 family lipoprotein [Thermodesulfobacteriota bacterium]|nr:LPP20 family lipoprotein [Thermodesulfobacteriota bacterium]